MRLERNRGRADSRGYLVAYNRITYRAGEGYTTNKQRKQRDRPLASGAWQSCEFRGHCFDDGMQVRFVGLPCAVVRTGDIRRKTLQGTTVSQVAGTTIAQVEVDQLCLPVVSMLLARVLDVPPEIVHANGYRLAKGVRLRPEMRIESTGRNSRLLGEPIDGRAAKSMAAKHPPCAAQDVRPGSLSLPAGSVCHATPQITIEISGLTR